MFACLSHFYNAHLTQMNNMVDVQENTSDIWCMISDVTEIVHLLMNDIFFHNTIRLVLTDSDYIDSFQDDVSPMWLLRSSNNTSLTL